MRAIELEHTKTGSCHLHLERDDNNNAFKLVFMDCEQSSLHPFIFLFSFKKEIAIMS